MSDAYVGEIRMFAGNFAPQDWAFCSGQILSISEYSALFSLIGTSYGGDGQSTFALPDLRSRMPMHQGSGYPLGQLAGAETVTLNTNQLPQHSHLLQATGTATVASPAGALLASPSSGSLYLEDDPASQLNGAAIGPVGGNQPHNNISPFLSVSFIICLNGIFPSTN